MDFEFDKEIDVLLRQTAQSGDFVSNQTAMHLDADEISAFAENALPEKAKQRSMLHLADCATCRKTLSSVITLNAEIKSETVSAAEKQPVTLPIAWYQKLFAFPNLAYAMGALVLVFSGIVGYTVLQNGTGSRSAEVSQISERQLNGKKMNSDGDAIASEPYSSNTTSSNMMMSNSASMNSISNMAAAANLSNPVVAAAPVISMNSNAAAERENSEKILRTESESLAPQEKPAAKAETQDSVTAGAPPPQPAKEDDYQSDGEVQKQQPNETQNSIAQNQTNITPDSRSVQSLPMLTRRAESKSKKSEESRNDAREKSIETTSVGGKTFKRENNVWYDSAYRQQPTTNATRGTNEYKKLDSGLRGIAETLSGTIIIVWKQKAYRIQ